MTQSFKQLGQLFMVGFAGKEIDQSTLNLIKELGINHFIIFKRNVESPSQLKKLCFDLKEACRSYGLPPPLISIDQEGGTVARLPEPFSQFPDARFLAESENPLHALSGYARKCGLELAEAGINMNLAPVLDVCPVGEGFFMEKRSLGADPEIVGKYGCHIIKELQSLGVAACAKHFPGLGAAKIDPHLLLPVVSQSRQAIEEVDLPPFQQAISAGVASVMTSHTIYENLDSSNIATLSASILKDLLRDKLGFDGLVITDDLEMGAVENERSVAEAAVLSFVAGVDLLLICHDHEKVRAAYGKLHKAVLSGNVSREECEESLRRVDVVRDKFA
ncbi:MAG: beta-N-acetylhexosaminidase [Desulfobulbaceae bacterium]|nr:beta-N-acetylhexosaminidase [Desulfobulbaceae bacterium]